MQECPCPLTTSGNNFARTCSLASDGDVQCHCERGYIGRRCESCDRGYVGNPLLPGGSCQPRPVSECNPSGTHQVLADGSCMCKTLVTGSRCDQCMPSTYYLNSMSETGCVECFCMGVSKSCTSSSWFRDSVKATFSPNIIEFSLVTDYERPDISPINIQSSASEVLFQISSGDSNVYYWQLPSRFVGNKLTAYGGNLNYTIRYVPLPGGLMSRNNAPDVVIRSTNDITILHYRRDEILPSGSQSYVVPIVEQSWHRSDGNTVNREHLLMALADVSNIFIKGTYTTTTEEAALSYVSLDTASEHNTGSYVRAVEVEQCSCAPGHQGLSCEDCSPGYSRGLDGIYLGLCHRCECNGHSDECDPETGTCENCLDNTAGDQCDICAPGYSGNATHGSPYDCEPDASRPVDNRICDECDRRGYTSCDGVCKCKVRTDCPVPFCGLLTIFNNSVCSPM